MLQKKSGHIYTNNMWKKCFIVGTMSTSHSSSAGHHVVLDFHMLTQALRPMAPSIKFMGPINLPYLNKVAQR